MRSTMMLPTLGLGLGISLSPLILAQGVPDAQDWTVAGVVFFLFVTFAKWVMNREEKRETDRIEQAKKDKEDQAKREKDSKDERNALLERNNELLVEQIKTSQGYAHELRMIVESYNSMHRETMVVLKKISEHSSATMTKVEEILPIAENIKHSAESRGR